MASKAYIPTLPLLDLGASGTPVDAASLLTKLLRYTFSEEELESLSKQQGLLQDRVLALKREVQTLSTQVSPARFVPPAREMLYGGKLILCEKLPNPLCKSKYFHLKIGLESLGDAVYPPELTMVVHVKLETSESTSLETNMSGKPILRGDGSCTLRYEARKMMHVGCMKMQITEVSSHFVNGWVRLVVSAGGEEVQPLVLEDVVIRAKEKTCNRFREREKRGLPQLRIHRRHF